MEELWCGWVCGVDRREWKIEVQLVFAVWEWIRECGVWVWMIGVWIEGSVECPSVGVWTQNETFWRNESTFTTNIVSKVCDKFCQNCVKPCYSCALGS